MIDQIYEQNCDIFLCYRGEGAEIAKNFKKGLSNIKNRNFGYVWYSDQENIGNFVKDPYHLIPSAKFAVIFFSKNFTKDFLIDGKNNYGDQEQGTVGCVTVREIVEIERCRQAGTLTVMGVHLDGYTLLSHDIAILKKVFENAGVLARDSLSAYTELNINAYYPRSTDVDAFTVSLSKGMDKKQRQKKQGKLKVHVDRMMQPLGYRYYGRDDLLEQAENAWGTKACLNITGPGGSGKSAFAFHWLRRMAQKQYHGAEYVMYWSFEQNGRNVSISPDLSSFFEFCLDFFDIDDVLESSSELEKATALATFLQTHSVILILDGIDVFQSKKQGQEGVLVNQSIRKIVNAVSRYQDVDDGMLVLLSTYPVTDLQYYAPRTMTIGLTALTQKDCVHILRDLGVTGSDKDLGRAAMDLNCDPMAVTLMGRLLASHYNGSIKERYRVNYMDRSAEFTAQILNFYGDLWSPDTAEGAVLLMSCLFRFSIQPDILAALVQHMKDVPEFAAAQSADLPTVMKAFRKAGLLHGDYELYLLPIVREHYRRKFRKLMPEAYRRCNLFLGDTHSQLCNDEDVSTIADMSPLYDAVFYYNRGDDPETAISILWNRIYRRRTFFSQKQLGATTSDLFAISLFFDVEHDWKPNPKLSQVNAAWLSSVAAYLLNNIGNLKEAERLRHRELEIYGSLSQYLFLASDGQNLARNLMLQGKIDESEEVFLRSLEALKSAGEQPVVENPYAKDFDVDQLRTNILTRYAYLLYLRGPEHWQKAKELLHPLSSERLHETTTGMFYYCYIRLQTAAPSQARKVCKEIEKEYLTSFDHRKRHEVAYANLLLARTTLARATAFTKRKAIQTAQSCAQCAIENAMTAGRMDQLPLLLNEVLRMYLQLASEEHAQERRDELLSSAWSIITDLEETFSLHELPIYRLEFLFLKAQYHAQTGDLQKARQIYSELSHSPICIRYFSHRIKDLKAIIKE